MKESPRSRRLPELRMPAERADAERIRLIANTNDAIP
jgi:hypothetical protein